ncbi:MAG: hypothetical protein IPI02_16210 [Sterolibacteriaceae bacterium]|nr:hypothetical protein [Sterolibacteriaceae bacterium]
MIHPTLRRLRLAPLLLACAGTVALADSQMLPGAWEFKMTRDSESATVKVSTSAAHIGECTSEMPVQ